MKLDTIIDLDKWNVYAMGDLKVPLIIGGVILVSFVVAEILGAWWKNGN